jgi:serine/threonine protein phosphatase PrpC
MYRYGPRSCIPVPDISAVTIPSQQFARFILASDGVWDVMSTEQIQTTALKFADNDFVAEYIANKAVSERSRRDMRPDDVTVIIVDINPDYFVPASGEGCNCLIN